MSLVELHISNFVVIEDQTISFGPGLNVLSGETGSGKSVVLQALELILGARPKSDFIRPGSSAWQIEAAFDLAKAPESLIKQLPEIAQGSELVMSRSMNSSGKGRVLINGHAGTVSLLEEVGSVLISICGQHQHVRLLEPRYHLELVDNFADNNKLLENYREVFQRWKEKEGLLRKFEEQKDAGGRRGAELEQLIQDLGELGLRPGLRDELEAQVSRAGNAEKLSAGAEKISDALGAEGGVSSVLASLRGDMDSLSRLDPELQKFACRLLSLHAESVELERDMRGHFRAMEIDADEIERMRERLAALARYERRHRTNEAGLLQMLESSRSELSTLKSLDSLDEIRREVESLFETLQGYALQLSALRKKAGEQICSKVMRELCEVGMRGVHLELSVELVPLGPAGQDRMQFLILTNSSGKPRALKEVASGGELSRIMLVLKKVLRDKSGVNVLVFDEIDSGVSGGVARAVGKKLQELAAASQVICITHLPQIASLAAHHYLVDKKVGKKPVSVIRELSEAEKVEEIARMLAGYEVTAAARESARELLSSN